jgi:hypothetical protein
MPLLDTREERLKKWTVWSYCSGCGWSDPTGSPLELELFASRHYACGPDETRGPEIKLMKGPRKDVDC